MRGPLAYPSTTVSLSFMALRLISRLSQGLRDTNNCSRGYRMILRSVSTWKNGDDDNDSIQNSSTASSEDPLYALVTMIQKLKQKRTTANELYVRRVLRDQIGLSEKEIGSLFGQKNASILHTISVKQNIEPVVLYLRSIGIVGSALVDLIVREPFIMCTSVDHLYNVHEWLKRTLSPHVKTTASPAVILQCPQLVTMVSLEDLDMAARALERSCEHTYPNLVQMCIWKYPDQFCRFAQEMRDNSDMDHQQYIMTIINALQHNQDDTI